MLLNLVWLAYASFLRAREDRRQRVVLTVEDVELLRIVADRLHGQEEFGLASGVRAITRRGRRA